MKKVFVLFFALLSFVVAEVKNETIDLQKEYIELKVELAKLKELDIAKDGIYQRDFIIMKNDIKDIDKEIKQNIKELENRINSFEIKINENKTRMDSFDNGIGFYLSIYGIGITILLIIISVGTFIFSSYKAKKQINDWLKENAPKQIEPYIEKAKKDLEPILEQFKKDAKDSLYKLEKDAKQEIDVMIKSLDSYTEEEKQKVQKDSQDIEKIDRNKRTLKQWHELFLARYFENNFKEAIEIGKKIIEINPKDDEAYYNMGYAYDELQEYQKAIDSYQKAIEINPKYDKTYNNMGIAYGKLEEYQKAIDSFKKAIEINPKKDEAYINYFELGLIADIKIDESIETYLQNTQNRETQIEYQILLLFKNISEAKEANIENFFIEYVDVIKELKTWSFDELETWANKKDEPIKSNLLNAINRFKEKLGQK
jgi:tetratricopeptide (TPR) repeat protein